MIQLFVKFCTVWAIMAKVAVNKCPKTAPALKNEGGHHNGKIERKIQKKISSIQI